MARADEEGEEGVRGCGPVIEDVGGAARALEGHDAGDTIDAHSREHLAGKATQLLLCLCLRKLKEYGQASEAHPTEVLGDDAEIVLNHAVSKISLALGITEDDELGNLWGGDKGLDSGPSNQLLGDEKAQEGSVSGPN
jgi:hypothetical protein